jgi:hypothetical protein
MQVEVGAVRPLLVASALAASALFVAACGSSHATQTGTTSSTTASRQTGAVAYARCMRTNGVPNWPDPESNGTFDKRKLGSQQLRVSVSQLQAAQSACQHLLPNGGRRPNLAQQQYQRTLGLNFARCVRNHGVPNFPDPDVSGRIPDPESVGIDQGSPKFRAANDACAKYRPPYIPSNSAYDAYVQSQR